MASVTGNPGGSSGSFNLVTLTLSQSGSAKTVTGTLKAKRTGGTNGLYQYSPQAWDIKEGVTVRASGTWTYDFQAGVGTEVPIWSGSFAVSAFGTVALTAYVNYGNSPYATSVTLTVNVPVTPAAPSAPTIGTPVRVSDVKQTVHWTRNASTGAPYDSQQVQRRVHTGEWGAWAGISTIATDYTNSGAMSLDDTGTVANRVYQYRVKASNAGGEQTSASSLLVFTTPGALASLTAAKTATGGVKLDLTHTVQHTEYKTMVEYSTDGDTWELLTVLNAGVLTYTWNSPPAGQTLVFRAWVFVDIATAVIGNGLSSAVRTSNSVALAGPPNPPSALAPNGETFDAGTTKKLTWKHNPVDTSPQSAYELRHRPVGGSWTSTGKITATGSERTFPAGTFTNGVDYEWQVRTWGVHADASAWSNTATFACSAPPVATITAPSSTLDAALVTVTWSYFDEESTTQSAWQAELTHASVVVESLSGSGGATSAAFATRLTDATSYTVRVRVRDGDGLWSSWDQVTFTTDFPLPVRPRATAVWEPVKGAVILAIENLAWPPGSVLVDTDGTYGFELDAPTGDTDLAEDTDRTPAVVDGANDLALVIDIDGRPAVVPFADAPDPGAVPAVSNEILRSVDGDTWVSIATGVAIDAVFIDPTAPVGVEVLYKVIAWSDLPSSTESYVVSIVTPGDCGYWSAGDLVVRMVGDVGDPPRVDMTAGLAVKTLHYFAGRLLPVEVAGAATLRTGTVSFLTFDGGETDVVRQLALLPAPHLFRAPDVGSVYASIGPVSETRFVDGRFQIACSITEVGA